MRPETYSGRPDAGSPSAKAQQLWSRWVLQTARNWQDVADVVRMTDIDLIDQDHRKIVELTLELGNVLQSGEFDLKKIRLQSTALENLYAYSEYHFHREERLIQQFDLPYIDRQRSQHHALLARLRTVIGDFEQGRLTATMNLKSSVLEWWVSHINELDYQTFSQEGMVERIIHSADNWEAMQDVVKPVGIADLDAEHRQLAVMALWLVKAARQGGETKENLYLALYQAAEAHFQHEEKLITAHGLPGLDEHSRQHAKFLQGLQAYVDAWDKGDRVVSEESLYAILGWWVAHINEVDAPFFSFDRVSEHVFTSVSEWDDFRRFIRPSCVPQIDQDHEVISSLLLRIDRLAVLADGEEATARWLEYFDSIIAVIRKHFTEEQALMAQHQLPVANVHRDEHEKFLLLLSGYREDVAHRRLLVSATLKQHILDWWVNHANQFDYPTFSALEWDDSFTL